LIAWGSLAGIPRSPRITLHFDSEQYSTVIQDYTKNPDWCSKITQLDMRNQTGRYSEINQVDMKNPDSYYKIPQDHMKNLD
jgi:hypothetical protein